MCVCVTGRVSDGGWGSSCNWQGDCCRGGGGVSRWQGV